ncbi:MAG: acylphosphatase [Planctomycetia bacterium]|nr:acylphosphatase [Planctomycetia bacterium]
MKLAEILVTGKVQGVWFRDFVKKNADVLNINGWVKNNNNGTVSITVEGKEKEIDRLIDKIKIGSLLSKVENVEVNWQPCFNKYNSFKIIR